VFGWLLNALMRIVLPLMPELSPLAMCYLTFASAILPHIAIASNAPILYVFRLVNYSKIFGIYFNSFL
jgi:hypothetical protein